MPPSEVAITGCEYSAWPEMTYNVRLSRLKNAHAGVGNSVIWRGVSPAGGKRQAYTVPLAIAIRILPSGESRALVCPSRTEFANRGSGVRVSIGADRSRRTILDELTS